LLRLVATTPLSRHLQLFVPSGKNDLKTPTEEE